MPYAAVTGFGVRCVVKYPPAYGEGQSVSVAVKIARERSSWCSSDMRVQAVELSGLAGRDLEARGERVVPAVVKVSPAYRVNVVCLMGRSPTPPR